MPHDHMDNWQGVTLLLLNSQPDTITLLSDWFGALGAAVHHLRSLDLCHHLDESKQLLNTIRPDVILFDLSIPYAQNWQCFKYLSETGLFGSAPVILTTTNRRAVDEIVGPTDAFEVLGTPHDLWHLQELVEWRVTTKRAGATPTRH
jgi:CheY-like chemotaxis protein